MPGYQRWHGERVHEVMERLGIEQAENGEYIFESIELQRQFMDLIQGYAEVADYEGEEDARESVVGVADGDLPPAYALICHPVVSRCDNDECLTEKLPMQPRHPSDPYPIEFDATRNIPSAMSPSMALRVHVRPFPVLI